MPPARIRLSAPTDLRFYIALYQNGGKILYKQMSHDILELEGRKEAEVKVEEEDAECVETRVWLWDGDEYEEF